MRAVVLSAPGPVENLTLCELPMPPAREGWVRIRVEAFGVNRSELHTRLGLAQGVTFPRVPGIECAGVVDEAAPQTGLAVGQKVVAMMGGMGRTFDGGYAEYTSVPASQVIPVSTELPWEVLGALPEMMQTAHGSLATGLDLRPGQSLLVRGGTSSIGMAAIALGKDLGATVFATTRRPERVAELSRRGVDHPILDTGNIAADVRALAAGGVDAALELVGATTLRDTLRCVRVQGVACFTGMLSNDWIVKDFYPIDFIPTGVRLTSYGGNASDLPVAVFQRQLDRIAQGRLDVPIHKVYEGLEQIRDAHRDMEDNAAIGKLVVRVRRDANGAAGADTPR